MNRNAWLFLLVLAVIVVLLAVLRRPVTIPAAPDPASPPQGSASASPQKQTSASQARNAGEVRSPRVSRSEPQATTPDAALVQLAESSGLAFADTAQALSFGNGGITDPTIGFYEWVIVSQSPVSLPDGRQIGDAGVHNLLVSQAVEMVEAKLTDTRIENAEAAFSLSWQKSGLAFSGTWVRAQNADYLIVQQTRN